MNNFGILITKLVLRGIGKKDALLEFSQGLNVVAGASDTGKSFAFECINFSFGATDIPDIPNEANGYDDIYLEFIEKSTDVKMVLKRSLEKSKQNKIYLFYSDLENVHNANFEELSNSSRAKKSLSAKLLEFCKCPYQNVLTSKLRGKTEVFSFRKYVYLTMINESRIVQKNAPIYMGDTRRDRQSTKEVAAFFTVLSGNDYKKKDQPENAEIKKAQLEGAIDELLIICDSLRREIAVTEDELSNYNITEINEIVEAMKLFVKEQRVVIEKHEMEREQILTEINTLETEKERILNNLSKFKLLKKNYESDIERLEFIEQSHEYTGQLENITCPICNTPMKTTKIDVELFYIAISKEKLKLYAHMRDLQETIEDFENDIVEIGKSLLQEKKKLNDIEDALEQCMEEASSTLISYENYQKIHEKSITKVMAEKKLEDTLSRIDTLNKRIENTKQLAEGMEIKKLSAELLSDFCNIIQVLLESWKFIPITKIKKVLFDEKVNDLIISNKTKASYGKGARAIINSAFVIAIMQYCRFHNLPHPGFVILDSPLTTFKERDKTQNMKNEDIDKSIKDSFYYNLAEVSVDSQIIIFDNELPPTDLKNMTYHRFTGNVELERTGFVPN